MPNIRSRLEYAWNNSSSRALTTLRNSRDAREAPSAVTSGVPGNPDAPTFSYSGYELGQTNILQLLDTLRAKRFPGEPRWAPAENHHADLRFVGRRSGDARRDPELVLPFRIHLQVDTREPDVVKQHLSKREKSNYAKANRDPSLELRVEITRRAVQAFYTDMHLPTMASRHAESARTESIDAAYEISRRGGLFMLSRNGADVAGCLFTHSGGVLTTRLLGVLGGRDDLYDNGTFKALYFKLLAKCAEVEQVQTVDLFGTEAFISKGIFQWKRRLGAGVAVAPNHFGRKELALSVMADNPGVRDFLSDNPFLVKEGGLFRPIYFFDDSRPPRLDLSCSMPGVESPTQVHLDDLMDHGPAVVYRRIKESSS